MRRGSASFLASTLFFLAANDAHANGRYPTAGLVVFHPRDAGHFAVRTTFGLLESRNGGKTFDYVCESALKLAVEEDPMLAFTDSGPLVVATFGGVLASDDGCNYRYVPGLEGEIVLDIARSASAPDSLVAFRLLGKGDGLYESGVIRSDDAGASFTRFPLFPEEILPITVDFAATEPSRVFLSARRGEEDGFDSVLLVSDDGGETFRTKSIPSTAGQRLAYIAGVYPSDPDRLYLRVDDLEETTLYETRDAGATFRSLFTGRGRLTGFAISPDGAKIAFGGLDEGLFVGAPDDTEFERRSDVGPTCLAWNADALWACADAQRTGFSFGRSTDEGRTFEPLIRFADLCGRSSCGGETDVGVFCPNDWTTIAPALGATCSLDGGTPDATDAPNETIRPAARGGCSLSTPATRSSPPAIWPSACALLFATRWRRKRSL